MLYLLIDVGNTYIKWALAHTADTPDWPNHQAKLLTPLTPLGRCETQRDSATMLAQLESEWTHAHALRHTRWSATSLPELAQPLPPAPTLRAAVAKVEGIRGVCVAGDAIKLTIAQVLQHWGIRHRVDWLTGQTPLPGLRNDYATPATLGSDRWLAVYGMLTHMREHADETDQADKCAVLATFGTATTVDVLLWDAPARTHVFAGGIIIAGLQASLRSVSASTAQLPQLSQQLLEPTQLSQPDKAGCGLIPNTTAQALLQGALMAQAGAVQSMLLRVRNQALQAPASQAASAKHSGLRHEPACFLAGGGRESMHALLPDATLLAHPVFWGLQASLKI